MWEYAGLYPFVVLLYTKSYHYCIIGMRFSPLRKEVLPVFETKVEEGFVYIGMERSR